MEFSHFKAAVAAQWQRMQQHPLFRVDIESGVLWQTYLASFRPGDNPVFRERTEHDCACCRHFIRDAGNVVAVIDGCVQSIWDAPVPQEPGYEHVARALANVVHSATIKEPFLHYERTIGTDRNFEAATAPAVGTLTWTHFHVGLVPSLVLAKSAIPTRLGEKRADFDVLTRSLREITMSALDTVLDLIRQGSLYRGEEFRHIVEKFRTHKLRYDSLAAGHDIFAWLLVMGGEAQNVLRVRNTAIGTLLVNLSENALEEPMDLEDAVKAFEKVVAPTNYKRPTALVTPAMIAKAKATVEELGLTSALERRYAVLRDITINNVVFADRSAKPVMGGVFDELAAQAATRVSRDLSGVDEIPIERFIESVIPGVDSVEVLVENRHAGNFVSLIAPANPTAQPLLKWDNNFSWSYAGEVADSIRERVKRAGGNVLGDLCCRLAWSNYDDLDLHLVPPSGERIYFANRRSRCGGTLDVDMNAMSARTREPVENIFYDKVASMPEGKYTLYVNQYSQRETTNVGFEVEIDFLGTTYRFAHDKALRTGDTVEVARFTYTRAGGIQFERSLPSTQVAREIWGVPTQAFRKVNVLMLSPNHWDGHGVGNKHYFFMLDGCANDGTARGFYNEFLNGRLDPHRKVFEMVGSKMKPAPSAEQLSGLGFSSTQKNTLTCRVKGSLTRTINVVF